MNNWYLDKKWVILRLAYVWTFYDALETRMGSNLPRGKFLQRHNSQHPLTFPLGEVALGIPESGVYLIWRNEMHSREIQTRLNKYNVFCVYLFFCVERWRTSSLRMYSLLEDCDKDWGDKSWNIENILYGVFQHCNDFTIMLFAHNRKNVVYFISKYIHNISGVK